MTIEPEQEEFAAVCPYLGLGDDADSHATYATDAHRCYRLPNPTRIATGHQDTYCLVANHTSCPVFLGESAPRTAPAAAAGGGAAPRGARGGRDRAATPPPARGGTQPLAGARPRQGGAAPAQQRQRAGGSLGPRPRSGGISMPVATIGLFAMAIVVILVAILIQQAVGGGGDDNKISAADVVATNAALKNQQTRPATTLTPFASGTAQPGTTQAGGTPNPNQTPGPGTPSATRTGTPGPSGKTYTVKSGDTCGGIAANNNITLQQLLDANQMRESDCTALQIGQVLKLP